MHADPTTQGTDSSTSVGASSSAGLGIIICVHRFGLTCIMVALSLSHQVLGYMFANL